LQRHDACGMRFQGIQMTSELGIPKGSSSRRAGRVPQHRSSSGGEHHAPRATPDTHTPATTAAL